MAEKDFRVRKGIVVDGTASGTSVAVTTGNVVVSSGTIGITDGPLLSIAAGSPNVSILSSAPSNGNLKLAPNGTGDIVFDTDNLDVSADSMKISIKDNVAAGLDITEAGNSYLKFVTTDSSEQIVFGKNSTFNGTTIANLGTVSAATSITSSAFVGPIDGILGGNTPAAASVTTLAASGATTLSGAVTLGDATGDDITFTGSVAASIPLKTENIDIGTTSIGLNDVHFGSGGVINFDGGDITLTHSSENLTVAGGTLAAAAITGTTIDASTDFTIGSTVITDDSIAMDAGSIVMTPSTNDTLTISSTTNGVSNITTADGSGSLGATLTINAAGTTNLQYNANTKVAVGSGGIDVTGKMDATGTVSGGGFNSTAEQASAGTGIDLHSSATIRAKEDGGIYQDGDVIAASGTKLTSQNIENTNFRASDNNTVTGALGAGMYTIAYINLDNTSNNKYHAIEAECAFQVKVTSTTVRTRWLSQKLYACYDGNEVHFRTDNTRFKNTLAGGFAPGEFCAGLWTDGSDKYLTIGFELYEAKSSSDRTATFGVNINGISMPVSINA